MRWRRYCIPLARIETKGSTHTFKLLQRYAERGRLRKQRNEVEKELRAAQATIADCERKLADIDAKLLEGDGLVGYERHRLDSVTIRLMQSPEPAGAGGGGVSSTTSPPRRKPPPQAAATADSL